MDRIISYVCRGCGRRIIPGSKNRFAAPHVPGRQVCADCIKKTMIETMYYGKRKKVTQ